MEENNKHQPGHESTDINEVAVGKVGVALLIVTILSMVLVVGVFNYFKASEGGEGANVDPVKVFPQPQLEKTPIPDLKAFRQAEDDTLNHYGWVDKQKGVVRIPISQAMDMVVKKGLPVRPAAPAADSVSVPTESGLGPKMLPPGGPISSAAGGSTMGDGK
jgi:hypothetical protein